MVGWAGFLSSRGSQYRAVVAIPADKPFGISDIRFDDKFPVAAKENVRDCTGVEDEVDLPAPESANVIMKTHSAPCGGEKLQAAW